MLQCESTITLIKMAATLALLVFGLRLSTPVPHEVGPVPVSGQVGVRADRPAVLSEDSGGGNNEVSLHNAVYVPLPGESGQDSILM